MSELNLFLFITNIVVVLLCGALLPVIPFLTRKSFLFGVKVPQKAQNTVEAKELKRNYVVTTVIGGIAVLAASICQFFAAPNYTMFAVIFFPFILLAIQLAAYVPNNKKALELKSRLGWKVAEISYADTTTSYTRGNLSAMPHIWYIVYAVIVIASFIVALARYPSLPDPIPTHWGFDMTPDAWSPKTHGVVLFMPIFNLCMLAFMWLIGVIVEKTKLQIDHEEPSRSFAQHKKYRRMMGHGMGVMALALGVMFLILGFQTLYPGFTLPLFVIIAIIIAPSILVCVIAVRAGQGGMLLKVSETEISSVENGGIEGDNAMSDDRFWAWGLFYHNPDDPAYLVGDRFGTNLGFNYSRLPVKIGVAACIAALAAVFILVIILFRPLI